MRFALEIGRERLSVFLHQTPVGTPIEVEDFAGFGDRRAHLSLAIELTLEAFGKEGVVAGQFDVAGVAANGGEDNFARVGGRLGKKCAQREDEEGEEWSGGWNGPSFYQKRMGASGREGHESGRGPRPYGTGLSGGYDWGR